MFQGVVFQGVKMHSFFEFIASTARGLAVPSNQRYRLKKQAPFNPETEPHATALRCVPKSDKRKALFMVEVGKKAPDFKLTADDGKIVQLSKLKGRIVVVYFYPKDDTSGCTAEAKDFSCMIGDFAKAGADIIGISPDSAASHLKFKLKHELTVRLAADEDKTAALAYGVWVEKSMYGKKYMGVERSTFLVDPAGRVAKIWQRVKVPDHASEVLAAVKDIKSA
jgi:thioredoxin-dependent peroxiredoxin